MKMRMATATLLATCALGIGTLEATRFDPIEHFTAKSAFMTSASRLALRQVDIVITRWSTLTDHRALQTALLEKGSVAFLNLLCGYGPAGSIGVIGAPDVPIRYAWSVEDRDGGRRVYLATDEPVSLTGPLVRRFPDAEPLTFVELRINRDGSGEGKLSDNARLFVDESRDVIELRDYARRPVHLVSVQSTNNLAE
jgi:hypothetical protein